MHNKTLLSLGPGSGGKPERGARGEAASCWVGSSPACLPGVPSQALAGLTIAITTALLVFPQLCPGHRRDAEMLPAWNQVALTAVERWEAGLTPCCQSGISSSVI